MAHRLHLAGALEGPELVCVGSQSLDQIDLSDGFGADGFGKDHPALGQDVTDAFPVADFPDDPEDGLLDARSIGMQPW